MSAVGLTALIAGCGGGSTGPVPPPPPPPAAVPTSVAIDAGNQQTAAAGSSVATAPSVIVRDAQNRPLAGVTVQFAIAAGGGTVEGAGPATDASGIARVTRWVLGPSGTQRLTATVNALPPVTFEATLAPGTETIEVALPPGGGNFEITTAGHPYQGLKVSVPANAFTTAASWQMRVTAPGTPPTLPAGYQTAGPVLEVTTDAPRARNLLTLEIPITPATGRGVLIAIRDPVRGVTELLPAVSRTATTITVVTTHLRGDLLAGRGPSAGPALASGQGQLISIAEVFPITFPIPMPPVAPLLDPAADRWPVLDNGSGNTPGGFGPAIPAFQTLNQLLSGPPVASFVKGLAQPGFYAEAAPLAALELARQRLFQQMAGLLDGLNDRLRERPKSERDELMHQLLTGNLAMMRAVIPFAYTRPGQADVGFGVAYSSAPATTGVLSSASATLSALGWDQLQGFAPQDVKQTADGPTVATDGIIPLPSTILPFEQLADLLGQLQQLPMLSAAARAEANRQLASLAGLPAALIESRVLPTDAWLAVGTDPLVARSAGTTVRFQGLGGTLMLHFQTTGAEAAQSGTGTIGLGALPAIQALTGAVPAPFVFSPVVNLFGSLKQLNAAVADVIWGPFEVAPEEAEPDAENRVAFEASIPRPPTDGFRIRWEWGDGDTSDNLGLTTGTHTYDVAGDYQVIATLKTTGGIVLSADTVAVRSPAGAFWRITDIIDQDELLDPGAQVPFQIMLARLLAVPTSGLIAIDDEGGGKTVLRLRVLPSATWNPVTCCPSPAPLPGEMRQTLGERPTVTYAVGPFFAGFGTTEWSQSTGDLGAGTLFGQYVSGGTVSRLIKGGGTQVGPLDFIRISATRSGTTMTGTMTVYAWFQDEETGEVDPEFEPSTYVLNFSAVRLR